MLFGIRLMILLAIMGGAIAYIADKLGSKIGKKRLTIFSLRPHDTSVLLTVLSGVLISLCSVLILAVSSNSARTALFGMEKLQNEIRTLQAGRETALKEYESAEYPEEQERGNRRSRQKDQGSRRGAPEIGRKPAGGPERPGSGPYPV